MITNLNIWTTANDWTWDTLRDWGQIINDNFNSLQTDITAIQSSTTWINTWDETASTIKTKYESNSNTNAFTDAEKTKLWNVNENAEVNRTLEELQDLIAAMFQWGTHTNISVAYDDIWGFINLTGNTWGGATLTQEEVEDFVWGLVTEWTGINVTYDDAWNVLSIALSWESFTTALKNKLDALPDNASLTALLAWKKDNFTENTAFNKDFWTTAWTVLEGDKYAEIQANSAKVWITPTQASDITANNAKISYTDSVKVAGIEAWAEVNTINSTPTGSEVQVLNVVSITQANYDLITPVATTFYIIT